MMHQRHQALRLIIGNQAQNMPRPCNIYYSRLLGSNRTLRVLHSMLSAHFSQSTRPKTYLFFPECLCGYAEICDTSHVLALAGYMRPKSLLRNINAMGPYVCKAVTSLGVSIACIRLYSFLPAVRADLSHKPCPIL
jgi:hypothetical protein